VAVQLNVDTTLRLRWQPGAPEAEREAVAMRFAVLHDLDFALGGACGATTNAGTLVGSREARSTSVGRAWDVLVNLACRCLCC